MGSGVESRGLLPDGPWSYVSRPSGRLPAGSSARPSPMRMRPVRSASPNRSASEGTSARSPSGPAPNGSPAAGSPASGPTAAGRSNSSRSNGSRSPDGPLGRSRSVRRPSGSAACGSRSSPWSRPSGSRSTVRGSGCSRSSDPCPGGSWSSGRCGHSHALASRSIRFWSSRSRRSAGVPPNGSPSAWNCSRGAATDDSRSAGSRPYRSPSGTPGFSRSRSRRSSSFGPNCVRPSARKRSRGSAAGRCWSFPGSRPREPWS